MIFIFGPLYSGKRDVAIKILNCDKERLSQRAIWDVQNQAARIGNDKIKLQDLSEELLSYEIVIATETGGGVVPIEQSEREAREAAGYLNQLLARKADVVIRVFCGIPVILRGDLPGFSDIPRVSDLSGFSGAPRVLDLTR